VQSFCADSGKPPSGRVPRSWCSLTAQRRPLGQGRPEPRSDSHHHLHSARYLRLERFHQPPLRLGLLSAVSCGRTPASAGATHHLACLIGFGRQPVCPWLTWGNHRHWLGTHPKTSR